MFPPWQSPTSNRQKISGTKSLMAVANVLSDDEEFYFCTL